MEFSSHHHFYKFSRCCLLHPACLFTVHVVSGPPSVSCGGFLPPPLLQAFLLLVAGHVPLFLPSPASLFIYSSLRDCPSIPLQHSVHLALFATSLFCCYCLFFSFSFFPGWGSVFPGGYAYLGQGCLWEIHVPLTLLCGPRLPKPSGCRHLAVREPSWFLHLM
jgi:hypothetical protein